MSAAGQKRNLGLQLAQKKTRSLANIVADAKRQKSSAETRINRATTATAHVDLVDDSDDEVEEGDDLAYFNDE